MCVLVSNYEGRRIFPRIRNLFFSDYIGVILPNFDGESGLFLSHNRPLKKEQVDLHNIFMQKEKWIGNQEASVKF